MAIPQSDPGYIVDLKTIENQTRQQSANNAEFAQYLKTQDSSLVDTQFHTSYKRVASAIDCTKCGNCCQSLIVAPDYRDISLLASSIDLTTQDFKKKYMRRDAEGDMVFRQKPCPFLKQSRCSVYQNRPGLCRRYPYLDEPNILLSLSRVLRNLPVCPIVFNVFEEMKALHRSRTATNQKATVDSTRVSQSRQ